MTPETEALEITLLLEAVFQHSGFDFRGRERTAMRDSVHALMASLGVDTVSALQARVLHEDAACADAVIALGTPPGELFARPSALRAVRGALAASLRSVALPRLWLADCGGVEEVWTMAIVLAEEGLIGSSTVQATVASDALRERLENASIDQWSVDAATARHTAAGGVAPLSSYFEPHGARLRLVAPLRERIVWTQSHLATDASFNEFDVIVGAQALALLGSAQRQRTQTLFDASLARFGTLVLDRPFAEDDPLAASYRALAPGQPWYRRIG